MSRKAFIVHVLEFCLSSLLCQIRNESARPGRPGIRRLKEHRFEPAGEVQRNYRIEVSDNLQIWNTLTNFASTNAFTPLRGASASGQERRYYDRAATP